MPLRESRQTPVPKRGGGGSAPGMGALNPLGDISLEPH